VIAGLAGTDTRKHKEKDHKAKPDAGSHVVLLEGQGKISALIAEINLRTIGFGRRSY
jgi:uncharacterized protein YhfF